VEGHKKEGWRRRVEGGTWRRMTDGSLLTRLLFEKPIKGQSVGRRAKGEKKGGWWRGGNESAKGERTGKKKRKEKDSTKSLKSGCKTHTYSP